MNKFVSNDIKYGNFNFNYKKGSKDNSMINQNNED